MINCTFHSPLTYRPDARGYRSSSGSWTQQQQTATSFFSSKKMNGPIVIETFKFSSIWNWPKANMERSNSWRVTEVSTKARERQKATSKYCGGWWLRLQESAYTRSFVRYDEQHLPIMVTNDSRAEFFHCHGGVDGSKKRQKISVKCLSCDYFIYLEAIRKCFETFNEEMFKKIKK